MISSKVALILWPRDLSLRTFIFMYLGETVHFQTAICPMLLSLGKGDRRSKSYFGMVGIGRECLRLRVKVLVVGSGELVGALQALDVSRKNTNLKIVISSTNPYRTESRRTVGRRVG